MKKSALILAQSDTTAGFLSLHENPINFAKNRDKKNLQECASFEILKSKVRAPKNFRKMIRKSKKTTFIYQNVDFENLARGVVDFDFTTDLVRSRAIRAIDSENVHFELLKYYGLLYSSSANAHSRAFELDFALKNCDVLVLDYRGLAQNAASKIIKLGRKKCKILRGIK